MNGISGMNNTGKVDISVALAEALKEKGIGEDGNTSVVLDGDNVTITTRDPESGKEVSGTMKLPELKEGSEDEQVYAFLLQLANQFDEVAAQLKVLAGELGLPEPPADDGEPTPVNAGTPAPSDGSPATGSTSAQKAIFSIYDLINMMQKVAQQQRDSARNIRYTELESQKASIEAQADYQRTAARNGLIVSSVTCVAQCAVAYLAASTSVKEVNAVNECSAGMDITQAKNDLKTLECGKNPQTAAEQTAKMKENCPEPQQEIVNKKFDEICGQAKTDYEAAKSAHQGKMSDLKTAQVELEQAKSDLRAAKDANADQGKIDTLEKKVTECTEKEGKAVKDAETSKGTLEKAKENYGKALDKLEKTFDSTYEKQSAKTKEAEESYIADDSGKNKDAMTEARDMQKDFGSMRSLVKAKVVQEKLDMGIKPDTEAIRVGEAKLNDAKTVAATDMGYQLAKHPGVTPMVLQTMTQALGGLGQSLAHFVQTNTEAKATEEQATQKEVEQHRDETNQLFQQAQDVINNLLGLLKAVIQAESQTMQAIIRA